MTHDPTLEILYERLVINEDPLAPVVLSWIHTGAPGIPEYVCHEGKPYRLVGAVSKGLALTVDYMRMPRRKGANK